MKYDYSLLAKAPQDISKRKRSEYNFLSAGLDGNIDGHIKESQDAQEQMMIDYLRNNLTPKEITQNKKTMLRYLNILNEDLNREFNYEGQKGFKVKEKKTYVFRDFGTFKQLKLNISGSTGMSQDLVVVQYLRSDGDWYPFSAHIFSRMKIKFKFNVTLNI